MSDCFDYHAGSTPLLISIPHDGRTVPASISTLMTERAKGLPDTDWHVGRLHEFAKGLGASVIAATHSRYVVDLNRASTDENLYQRRFVTGLCPEKMFDGGDIYLDGQTVGSDQKEDRIIKYWRPYHDRIASALRDLRETFGYALLWDAHSIPSEVPLLFDGVLPELNFGTNNCQSCAGSIIDAVIERASEFEAYVSVRDARFKGGYITRHYGDPGNDVHAVQLELAQRCYMIEEFCDFDDERAAKLQNCLNELLRTYMKSAASHHEGRE